MGSFGRGGRSGLVRVDLRVRLAPDADPGKDGIFVAGNLPALGDWQPGVVRLKPRGGGTLGLSFEAPAGDPVELKITRGTWKSQAIYLDPGGHFPPDNRILVPVRDTRMELTVVDWLDRIKVLADPVVGDLRAHPPLPGVGLREPRAMQVWLPPSYRKGKKAYPVLYMHDGQNLFDPAQSFCGQDWKVDEVVSRLIAAGRIRELMVVGIPNSADRMPEYNLARKLGQAYARFLVERVKPFIDRTYRTLPGPLDTGIMGSSMGGLVSFQLAWAYPEVFGLAGCLSSAFSKSWAALERLIRTRPAPAPPRRIYFDTGELEPPIVSSFHRMETLLRETGLLGMPGRPTHRGPTVLTHLAPGAPHAERAWSERLHLPLEFLFPPK